MGFLMSTWVSASHVSIIICSARVSEYAHVVDGARCARPRGKGLCVFLDGRPAKRSGLAR